MASTSNDKMDSSMESLPSREKLMEKYKQALTIAQKAKNARDDAVKENKTLSAENDNLKGKVKILEKQYGTAEEMLAALTEQKLKLAMEIDDLKKQKAIFIQELKSKESAEIEAESFKRQYNRLVKENEDLIKKFGSTESESLQLRKEYNELRKDHDSLRKTFGFIQNEKEGLDKQFKETLERLHVLEHNQKNLDCALSKKFNKIVQDVSEWTHIISSGDFQLSNDEGYASEIERLKADKEKCNDSMSLLTKEKENIQLEVFDLNATIRSLRDELNIANSDRDKMMFNLEKVGLETKHLIENSEKLTDEMDSLKQEKFRQDQQIGYLIKEKENLLLVIRENESEINKLSGELGKYQRLCGELAQKLELFESANNSMDFSENRTDSMKEAEKSSLLVVNEENVKSLEKTKEVSVNNELKQLQEELKVFSEEIVKYKQIADEKEQNYASAMNELSKIQRELLDKNKNLENCKNKIAQYEELQGTLNKNLAQCKYQLESALEDLSQAEDLKNKLKVESEDKELKLSFILEDLDNKQVLIEEKIEEIKRLNAEINHKKAEIEVFEDKLKMYLDAQTNLENEVKLLTEERDNLRISVDIYDSENESMNDEHKKELTKLKENLNIIQSTNSALTEENTKLNKQLKDLLKQHADENNILVEKLTSLQKSLQTQEANWQSTISRLEKKLDSQEAKIGSLNVELHKIYSENNLLKVQIESQKANSSENNNALSKIKSDLEEDLKRQLKIVVDKEKALGDLKNAHDTLQEELKELTRNKLDLNELISNGILSVRHINSHILSDIRRLRGDLTIVEEEQSVGGDILPKILSDIVLKLKNNQSLLSEEINSILEANSTLSSNTKHLQDQLETEKSQLSIVNTEMKERSAIIKKMELQLSSLEAENKKINQDNRILQGQCDSLNCDYNKLKSNYSELHDHLKDLNSQFGFKSSNQSELIQNLKENIKSYEVKMTELDQADKNNSSRMNELTLKNKAMSEEIEELKREVAEKNKVLQTNQSTEENILSMNDEIGELSLTNKSLTETISILEEKLEAMRTSHSQERTEITNKLGKLKEELKNNQDLLESKTLELKENNKIWAGRFSSLKIALMGLNKSRKDIRNHFESIQNIFFSFANEMNEPLQEKMNLVLQASLSSAKKELITEMQLMNQALKERGECISKLEFSLTEHQSKMKELLTQNEQTNRDLEDVRSELSSLKESIKEKESQIRQLEEENDQLKEGHDNTADTDILSTSTISRTEESARLRDVEDSFEDRYSKLKILAVKMKKRIAELMQTLESERAKMTTERNEFQEKITSMSMAVKNAQKLQELFDQSLDERDELKKKTKALENNIESLKSSEDNLKSKVNSLETCSQNATVMKKHIDSLNSVIKESKSELQKLQMELKAENIKYEEMKKANVKLEAKLQELTSNFELAKQQGKNNNVLELEIKNYEKIVADQSSQINTERNVVKRLESEQESLKNSILGLQEQIRILEKQLKVEEERNQHSNEQLTSTRRKVEEFTSHVDLLNQEIEDLQKQITSEKEKNEALTLEVCQVTSNFSSKELSMASKIGALQEQIRSLETSLASTKQELTTAELEIKHLNEEYEGYKLRAQTILAKRKGEFVTHGEKEAKEEVERWKKDCQALDEKIEAYMTEIETLNSRLSSLSLEKSRSDKKCEDLKQALQHKIGDYDLLKTEFHNFKITNESTIENLKEELVKKKNQYHSELSQQRKIIDELTAESQLREEEALQQNKELNETPQYNTSFQEGLPLISEREDGEGSESVPSPKTRRDSSITPLDVLLNNPILDENKVVVMQEQVEKLRRELNSYEVRCRHLSSLLSEAEKDSARNLHQNKILKEEVRRLERSLERLPHVANTEYLKNVVFKFITLPHGDERSRLVPVLDTLLKLSPEETNKLNNFAKGESQAGWGSYLPSWTGL